MEGNNIISGYLERSFYYDKRGRLLQTVERYPDGGNHYVMNSYDFKGDIVRSEESCRIGTDFVPVLVNDFSYDSRSRLKKVEMRLSNKVTAKVRYEYDALGLIQKRIYGDSAAVETLSYNLQGWLTNQSSPAFSMSLRYYYPNFSGSSVSYTGNTVSGLGTKERNRFLLIHFLTTITVVLKIPVLLIMEYRRISIPNTIYVMTGMVISNC